MGLIKSLLKKFKCESKCSYNIEEQLFDQNILNQKLSNYELKHKDILKIAYILNKRERKPTFPMEQTI